MEEESKFRVTDYEDENRGRREKEATTNDQDLPSVMNLITVHNDEAKGGRDYGCNGGRSYVDSIAQPLHD